MRMLWAGLIMWAAMSGAAMAKDACALLGPDDAAMVLGQAVGQAQPQDGGCIYNTTGPAGHSLIITMTEFGDAAKTYFDMTAKPADPGNSSVPGMGDAAVLTDSGGILMLRIRKGGEIVSLQSGNSIAADPKAALLKAGQKVAGQL